MVHVKKRRDARPDRDVRRVINIFRQSRGLFVVRPAYRSLDPTTGRGATGRPPTTSVRIVFWLENIRFFFFGFFVLFSIVHNDVLRTSRARLTTATRRTRARARAQRPFFVFFFFLFVSKR